MPARRVLVSPQGAGGVLTATPTFSPVAGTYGSTQNVVISDASPSPVIHYTTDGTSPTLASPVYSTPIVVSVSETLKAFATSPGLVNSPVATAVYVIGSALSITTTSPLPAAVQGVAYTDTMAATGGTPPYTWSLTSQTGSNGWAVSSAGVVSGTPGTIETDSLVIKVTDSVLATASGTFSLTVGTAATVPTNVQVIQQGETGPTVTAYSFPNISGASVNRNQIGWQSVPSATSYNIYRSTNGGAFVSIASRTAAQVATDYSTYVTGQGIYQVAPGINSAYVDAAATNIIGITNGAILKVTGSISSGSTSLNVTSVTTGTVTLNQGIGGPGIPPGAIISSFGTGAGGTGTYNLSLPATANETAQTFGTVYFGDQSYLYQVTAIVSAVESAPSATSIILFIANGLCITCGGVFNGTIIPNQTAPTTTPLGYSKALQWTANTSENLINTFSGYSPDSANPNGGGCAGYNLSVAGYNFIHFAIYCPQAGLSLQANAEIAGDGELSGVLPLSNWGPATLTQNAWTHYKIPLGGATGIYTDAVLGATNVNQTAFYKITWQFTTIPTVNNFIEVWFTVS